MKSDETSTDDSCNSCPLMADRNIERRQFLRGAGAAAVLAAAGVLFDAGKAAAMQVVHGSGYGSRSDKAYPIPATDGAVIDKSESVIIARSGNRAWAFSLACPHQNTALRWDDRNDRFQCPKHKSRYRPDGTFIEGRATRGLDRFAVRREADRLMVNLELLYREDDHPSEWARAFVSLA